MANQAIELQRYGEALTSSISSLIKAGKPSIEQVLALDKLRRKAEILKKEKLAAEKSLHKMN
jgi:hypothetical protein